MASQWCKNCNEQMSLIFYSGEMEHYQCPYCKQFITVKTIEGITPTKPDNEDVSKLCGGK